jgi:hypothetical protein
MRQKILEILQYNREIFTRQTKPLQYPRLFFATILTFETLQRLPRHHWWFQIQLAYRKLTGQRQMSQIAEAMAKFLWKKNWLHQQTFRQLIVLLLHFHGNIPLSPRRFAWYFLLYLSLCVTLHFNDISSNCLRTMLQASVFLFVIKRSERNSRLRNFQWRCFEIFEAFFVCFTVIYRKKSKSDTFIKHLALIGWRNICWPSSAERVNEQLVIRMKGNQIEWISDLMLYLDKSSKTEWYRRIMRNKWSHQRIWRNDWQYLHCLGYQH